MERIDDNFIRTNRPVHRQYCDECGQCIGNSVEYEDGYYERYGEYELKVYVGCPEDHPYKDWYHYNKQLCKKCQTIKTDRFLEILEKFGFTPGMNDD